MGYTKEADYGTINMITPATTDLAVVGTYYSIAGTYSTSGGVEHFTPSADGKLTYEGNGGIFFAVGTSDVSADKSSEINYTLFINEVAGGSTPHTYNNPNKKENLSINAVITLVNGDVLEARAKSDTINTTISPSNLTMTFIKLKSI